MKKILLSLVALAAMAITANAQWYVGGNVGLSASASNSSAVNWNISPEGGYIINDNHLVGAGINFGGYGSNEGHGSNNFSFSVQPYYRWKFWGISNVNFWLEGRFSVGSYSENSKHKNFVDGNIYKDTITRGTWGIAVAPVITVDIDSNWSIVTKIASMGAYGTGRGILKSTDEMKGDVSYSGLTYFSFMAINGPSIGVYYAF